MGQNSTVEQPGRFVYNFTERQFLLTEMQLRSLLDKASHSKSFHKYVDGLIAFSSGVVISLGVTLTTVKGADYQAIGAIEGASIHASVAVIFWIAVAVLPIAVLAKRFKGKFLTSTDDAIQDLVGKSNSVGSNAQQRVALGIPITMGEISTPTNDAGFRPLAIPLDSPKIEPQLRYVSDDLEDDSESRIHSLESTTNTEIIRKSDDNSDRLSIGDLQEKILTYMVTAGLSDLVRIGHTCGDDGDVLAAVKDLDRKGLLALDGARVVITAQGRLRAAS